MGRLVTLLVSAASVVYGTESGSGDDGTSPYALTCTGPPGSLNLLDTVDSCFLDATALNCQRTPRWRGYQDRQWTAWPIEGTEGSGDCGTVTVTPGNDFYIGNIALRYEMYACPAPCTSAPLAYIHSTNVGATFSRQFRVDAIPTETYTQATSWSHVFRVVAIGNETRTAEMQEDDSLVGEPFPTVTFGYCPMSLCENLMLVDADLYSTDCSGTTTQYGAYTEEPSAIGEAWCEARYPPTGTPTSSLWCNPATGRAIAMMYADDACATYQHVHAFTPGGTCDTVLATTSFVNAPVTLGIYCDFTYQEVSPFAPPSTPPPSPAPFIPPSIPPSPPTPPSRPPMRPPAGPPPKMPAGLTNSVLLIICIPLGLAATTLGCILYCTLCRSGSRANVKKGDEWWNMRIQNSDATHERPSTLAREVSEANKQSEDASSTYPSAISP